MNNEKILSLLTLQLNHVKQLEILLNDEKQSLINRDYKTITSLSQQKQQLMSQLHEIDKEISLANKETPLNAEALIKKDQILSLLAQCHKNNLINGKAIELSMNSIERLQRSIIQKRANKSMTYNAKGGTKSSFSSSGYTSA